MSKKESNPPPPIGSRPKPPPAPPSRRGETVRRIDWRQAMDSKAAKKVLIEMQCDVMPDYLSERYPPNDIRARSGSREALLDGRFTADQLEAIAAWMRNPEGVAAA